MKKQQYFHCLGGRTINALAMGRMFESQAGDRNTGELLRGYRHVAVIASLR